MPAGYRNIRRVMVGTSAEMDYAIPLGEVMATGTTTPDNLAAQLDALADGRSLSAGKTAEYGLRVLNAESAAVALLQTAEEDGTDVWIFLINRSETQAAAFGPAKCTGTDERPPVLEPARDSILVGFNVAGDTGRDFLEIIPMTT